MTGWLWLGASGEGGEEQHILGIFEGRASKTEERVIGGLSFGL